MRTLWSVVITAAVSLAVAGGVGWWIYQRFGKPKVVVPEVRTETPTRGDLVEIVSAPGRVEAKTKVSIRTRISARIVALPHKAGDRVKKGDVLVRLDDSDIEAAIARLTKDLAYATITSPIDGVVTRIDARVGELAAAGMMNRPGPPIMEVADLSRMLAVAMVEEADIGAVAVGQHATVRVRSYADEPFEGTVDSVALAGVGRDYRAQAFPVVILLETGGKRIHSGLTADVSIETRRHKDVMKVPSQAVLARRVDDLPAKIRKGNPNVDPKKALATVVYRCIDDKAVVTPVAVGASDATRTVILSGLDEADRVITGPYKVLEKLKHDQKVEAEEPLADETKPKPPATQTSPAP